MLQNLREELLVKFVKQPPTDNPLVEYLRKIEWTYSLRFLSKKRKVLDIGSEINVSKKIKSTYLYRIDFSQQASNRAAKLLRSRKNDIVGFYIITSENPLLPFEESFFDGAISIGPFDFRFVNIKILLTEVYRVLSDKGVFIISVPTIKSPYYDPTNKLMAYYMVDEILQILTQAGFIVDDFLLIFAPKILFSISGKIPKSIIRLIRLMLAPLLWVTSKVITRFSLFRTASYLVCKLTKGTNVGS